LYCQVNRVAPAECFQKTRGQPRALPSRQGRFLRPETFRHDLEEWAKRKTLICSQDKTQMETAMISALVLAVASLSTPSPAALPVRNLKGHPPLPARTSERKASNLPAACHPDPTKRRSCNHRMAKAAAAGKAPAFADAGYVTSGETKE
jgi:hypothetical protein